MLDKAAILKKCKMEGGARRSDDHPAALPVELLEVAASSDDFIPPQALRILGAACGIPSDELSSLDDIDPVFDISVLSAPRAA